MDVIPSFLNVGSLFWSAAPVTPSPRTGHNDLIAFLSVAQQHNVDILPISWQSALQPLGAGAQTEVSQSYQNLEKSFAFKRPNSQALPASIFTAAISEVL